jgi:hypothetical protein
MKLHCPACRLEYDLETALESEASIDFVAMIVRLERPVQRALIAYLGLFRTGNRRLSWDRALRLAIDVLALESDPDRLAAGLSACTEAIRLKRDLGTNNAPLKNHNYLAAVLAGMPEQGALVMRAVADGQGDQRKSPPRRTATERGLAALRGEG